MLRGVGRDARVHHLAHGLFRRFGDAKNPVPAAYLRIASDIADVLAFMLVEYSAGYFPDDYWTSSGAHKFIDTNISALYVAARAARLRTTEHRERGLQSFRSFQLENKEVSVWALLHRAVPMLTFTAPNVFGSPTIDPPVDVVPLKQVGWRIMTARWGNQRLEPNLLTDLPDRELSLIRNYRPATLREVAFNGWDW